MVVPIVAAGGAKAAERAGKALTGDIYTRRWTTKGKKKTAIEHELHVNPLTLAVGAAAAGATALGAGVAIWLAQLKVAKGPPKPVRVEYVITFKNGEPVRYTYYLGSVPFKTIFGAVGEPWASLLPTYYTKRGYLFSSATQTSYTTTVVRGYAIYESTVDRFGLQGRDGFKIDVGGLF